MQIIASCIIVSCSSTDNDNTILKNDNIRKERLLLIKQGNNSAKFAHTRTILNDLGEDGIYASWEMGDKASIYNKSYPEAGYMRVTASSSTKNTNFTGAVDCQKDDVLRMFYPEINKVNSVTDTSNNGILMLDISNQKGTLEDIQLNYDFCYGEATVSDVTEDNAIADMGTSENLMAICKFTFKIGNDYLKSINKVKITGVHEKGIFTLSTSSPEFIRCQFADFYNSTKKRNVKAKAPEFSELDVSQGIITINAGDVDNSVYVALYPGSTSPSFEVTTKEGKYEGTLKTSVLKAGKYYNVVVNMDRTGDASKADYVEVCGVKWAKGNLQYDPVNGGDEGFMDNWRIAPAQWHYVGYDRTGVSIDLSDDLIKDAFNWGRLGDDAYNPSLNWATVQDAYYDINSKFYFTSGKISDGCIVSDGSIANLGDLAFYVSNGTYRLPRQSDFEKLMNSASYQLGHYETKDGYSVRGVLFSTPNNEIVKNLEDDVLFTDNDLENYLFLPLVRFLNSNLKLRSDFEDHMYLSSTSNNPIFSIRVYSTGKKLYFYGASRSYLIKIRPVLCE